MGARPMKRVIQEQIKRPLADDLLFGDLSEGGEVQVYALVEKGRKPAKNLYSSTEEQGTQRRCRHQRNETPEIVRVTWSGR